MLILQRATLPRFASDNRMSGTAEENKAGGQGSIAYFGTYAIDEAEGTISLRYDGSTLSFATNGLASRSGSRPPPQEAPVDLTIFGAGPSGISSNTVSARNS